MQRGDALLRGRHAGVLHHREPAPRGLANVIDKSALRGIGSL
ncbi:hypothetical protein ACTMU2_15035 [Cupriavidus basilensis]